MEETNVEVARALTQLWNDGVREFPTEYLDPAVELESPFSSISGEPYRGRDGIEQWVRDIDEQFSEWQIHLEDARSVRDMVLLTSRVRGRGRTSGIELDQVAAMVIEFRDDHRVTRIRIYWDLDAARRAVGLTE